MLYIYNVSDLLLKRLENGAFDLDFDDESCDLLTTESLENAVVLSLGTFARERSLDNVKSNLNPSIGGWWADSLSDVGMGSNVYESIPGKNVDATVKSVEKEAMEALQWMIGDGVAGSVSCSAKVNGEIVVIAVKIVKPDGGEVNYAYEMNWEATRGI